MEQHIEEYKLLKQEIINNNNIMRNFQIALYSATGLILTFAFMQDEPMICLLPYLVIIPLYLFRIKQSCDTIKVGAYMIVFLEGREFNWETRFNKYEKSVNAKKVSCIDFMLLIIASFLAFLAKSGIPDINYVEYSIRLLIGVVSMALCMMILLIKRIEPEKEKANYIARWNKIKEEESQSVEISIIEGVN